MDAAAAELGMNPVSIITRFSLSMEMSRLTRDGTAEPISRDHILRHARGKGNIHFTCSADHEQDWQLYSVDPYSAICDGHTYIQYNGGLLPDITLLTQCYYHNIGEPVLLNTMKRFFICSL